MLDKHTGADGGRRSLLFSAPESGREDCGVSSESVRIDVAGEAHWILDRAGVLALSVGLSLETDILFVLANSLGKAC